MEAQIEDSGSAIGAWVFDAHIEVRPPDASTPTSKLEKGELWFRLVLRMEFSDGDGEHGIGGDLSTPWLWSVNECAKQAKLLRSMVLNWTEFDYAKNEYVSYSGTTDFDAIIDGAVARFMATMPGVS